MVTVLLLQIVEKENFMGYMYNNRSNYRPDRCEVNDREYKDREFKDREFKDRDRQKHVHEVQVSVELADGHTHRFATVTGEACPFDSDHYHEVKFRTDFVDEHYH